MKWLPKSRVRYNAQALDPINAAAAFGYKYFEEFLVLPKEQQAYLIAAYRANNAIHAYQAHEASGSKK